MSRKPCATYTPQKIHAFQGNPLIEALPPDARTVFNMYVVEGFSHQDIADALGISVNTSRSQLLRARTLLQAKIKETEKNSKR